MDKLAKKLSENLRRGQTPSERDRRDRDLEREKEKERKKKHQKDKQGSSESTASVSKDRDRDRDRERSSGKRPSSASYSSSKTNSDKDKGRSGSSSRDHKRDQEDDEDQDEDIPNVVLENGSSSRGSDGSLEDVHGKYPLEGPHRNKGDPKTFGPAKTTFPISIVIEEEGTRPGCGGMNLQALVIAIAITEIFLGMINIILFATRLHIQFASKHDHIVVKHNPEVADKMLFFTKNEFSFLFKTYSEDHFDAMIEGTLALEVVRFGLGVFLFFGGAFPDYVSLLTWGWLTITPIRLIVSLIICPDALWLIVVELLAIWAVFAFQWSYENPETKKSVVYKTVPEMWIAAEKAGMTMA